MNPWGEMRADQRTAIVAAVMANANRDPARTPEAFRPSDFMPYLKADPVVEAKKLAERIVASLAPQRSGMSKAERSRRRREIGKAKR